MAARRGFYGRYPFPCFSSALVAASRNGEGPGGEQQEMIKFNPDSLIKSVMRIRKMSLLLQEKPSQELFGLLKKESNYCLRRAIGFWWSLRFNWSPPWRKK
jgi:hypothetical protein